MPSKSYTLRSVSAYNGTEQAVEDLARAQETIINLEEQLENAGTGVEEVINGTVSSLTDIDDGGVIRAGLFDGCENLVSYSNKLGYIREVGENAFRNCSSLTTLPQLLDSTVYGARAFQNCSSFRNFRQTIENNIPEHCFENSGYWVYANINNCNVGNYAFRLSKVSGLVLRPQEKRMTIGAYSFEQCSQLEEIRVVNYGYSVEIYDAAFYNCSNLTTVDGSEYITYIGHNAFANCSKLTSFRFNADINIVPDDAFWGCSKLTKLYSNGTVAQARNNLRNLSGIPATTVQCSDGVYTIGS